jgi:hypothetical protein
MTPTPSKATYGLSLWLPFFGTGFLTIDEYLIRSSMCAEFTLAIDSRIQDARYDILRKLKRMKGDFSMLFRRFISVNSILHCLTPYSTAPEVLMAWQYHLQDSARGFIQSFRREACPISSIRFFIAFFEYHDYSLICPFMARQSGQPV